MKASIIIPTYNHCEDFLKPLCKSIIDYTDLTDIEILIIANGCKDNTREYVQSLPPQFKLLWNDEGMGFTKAANWGVKESTGKIVILMNNDVLLLPQEKNTWINYLINPIRDKIGMTGNLKIWDASVERYFLVGFLVAIPRYIWDRVGGFDESWNEGGGGGEDIELCLKVEQLGYRIIQVPDEVNTIKDGINVNKFPSYHAGEGTMMDAEHKEKWVKHIEWVRERLKEKYQLPQGWFYGKDIDEYRRLVEDIPEGGSMCELGPAWGRSLCAVSDIVKRKKIKVTVVDCFTGTANEAGWAPENFRYRFEANIKRFGIADQVTILEGLTDDMHKFVEDKSQDFVFIDCDHTYESVKKDIENWMPKVKEHGTIAGHDYCNHSDNPPFGVSIAVNEKFSNVRVFDDSFVKDGWYIWGSIWSKRI